MPRMPPRQFSGTPGLAVALVTLAFGVVCALFVRQPGLASFADDSVSYLVMAQVFSPWRPASAAVIDAFAREAFYPPLWPLLLAATGAAHDFAWAQVLNALLLAACLPLVYALAARWLEPGWAAVGAMLTVALLPSMWIHVKGVLSEPLFCLLLLVTLWQCGRDQVSWRLALPMAALALTRTVGLALLATYVVWAMTRGGQALQARLRASLPALVAALPYAAWVWLRPAQTADDNLRLLLERGMGLWGGGDPVAGLAAGVLRQAQALGEAWVGSLMLYWVEGHPARTTLAATVGALALAGVALRAVKGKADAWLISAYLCVFLVWPFYEQMTRFLFPALPVLVLYAFYACAVLARKLGRPAAIVYGLFALLLPSLTVPALAFIHQRARAGAPHAWITDWYRTPALGEARARAQVHLDLFADMDLIQTATRPEDRVMWVVPSYIALLAGRRGVVAPPAGLPLEQYRERLRLADPDYVFLSRFHPRDTIHDTAWRAGTRAMDGRCRVVHARVHPDGTTVVSMLLRCDRAARRLQ
jgi:hypothetical protein